MTQVPPSTIWRRKAIAYPHSFRCGPEAKVIRLEGHAALRGLVQQHGEAQGTRAAFAETPQQELVSYPAFDHRIEHENVAALQFRPCCKLYFAAREAAVLDVTNFRAHEMANDRAVHMAQQVCRKHIAMIQNDHDIQAALTVLARDLPTKRRDASSNLGGGIR